MVDTLTVECPTCGQPTEYSPRNPSRPFCTERCRSGDLGAWASERFRIASQPEAAGDDDEAAGSVQPNPGAAGG